MSTELRLRTKSKSTMHVRRKLSGGQLNAKVGQVLEPHDILGEDLVNVGFTVLNLSKALSVRPESAADFLERPIGSKIFKDELLALKQTFFGQKAVVAPTDCIIEAVNSTTGEVRLKFLPKKIPLFSGVYGIVEKINLPNEVIIKTEADVIFGVIGSGFERFGQLRFLGRNDSLITKEAIDTELRSQILVAGALINADAIREVVTRGIHGIVTGGVNARVMNSVRGSLDPRAISKNDIGFSLLVTEGFGPLSLGDDIFSLLQRFEGKYVFINGNEARLLLPSSDPDSIINIRRVALPDNEISFFQVTLVEGDLDIGSRVRVTWAPFMGAQGKVVHIDGAKTKLDSGIWSNLVTVALKFRKIKVPIENIEKI